MQQYRTIHHHRHHHKSIQDPPSLLRLVWLLARLGTPPTALAPTFWERWEEGLSRVLQRSPDQLLAAVKNEPLAALSGSMARLGYTAHHSHRESAVVGPLLESWLGALAARWVVDVVVSLKG